MASKVKRIKLKKTAAIPIRYQGNKLIRRSESMKELGSTGLTRWGGVIDEEWLRALKGNQRWKTYKEMRDNDPIISAIRFAVDMLIRQVDWNVQPAGEDQEDIENSEFLESCLIDMSTSWENLITEIISFLDFGFSYHEIVYKLRKGPEQRDPSKRSRFDDGKIGWRKIPIRSQDTLASWDIDEEDGSLNGFLQALDTGKEIYIPIEKSLLFRTTSYKGNPEGKSILRGAYRSWFFKKRIEELEGIGMERDLAGLAVVRVPARIMSTNANSVESALYTEFKKILRNVRRDEQEGIILPSDRDADGNRKFEFELMTSGGQRQFDTSKIIDRYDQRIAMTVLADFILLGHQKVGSFALSSDKTNMFALALGAWLDEIASVFNRHAVPRLFALNGKNIRTLPELTHGDIETPDLQMLAEFISKLAGAGMPLFPDRDLENKLLAAASLPQRPEEEDEELEEGM